MIAPKNNLPTDTNPHSVVTEAALAWFAKMRSDARSQADDDGFQQWLAEDPEHEIAYRDLQLTWADSERFADAPDIGALLVDARAETAHHASARQRWVGDRHGAFWKIAASVVLTVGMGLFIAQSMLLQEDSYQTAIGDRQTVRLSDGSDVVMNTDTAIRVRMGFLRREIVLDRGQAHFKVAHTVYRPFIVDAGSSRITALGTAFDVFKRDNDVKVTLVEGQVEVVNVKITPLPTTTKTTEASASSVQASARSSARLAPGQSVEVTPAGLSDIAPASLVQATAWMDGRLIFDNERLQDVIDDVNRYSAVRVVIADAPLAETRITGVFRAGRADSFVEALQATHPVRTTLAADGTVILHIAR
jgi:transmembrane sensor